MQRTNFNVFSEEFYDRQNVLSALNNLLICSLIVGSCFVKLPQLKKIISNKNAAGLSIISFYLEIIVSTSLIAFSIKKKINYKLYLDIILINVQNLLIVYFMWKYNNKYSKYKKAFKISFYVLFNLYLLFALPDVLVPLLGITSAPLRCLSKIPQIYLNHKNKNTRNLSFTSCVLVFCGNLAKIFTILFNIDNIIYIVCNHKTKLDK
ncbi:conserved Plasmodium protein, unknown function [Plasmodium malariae]|uniref:PQ-loop repeat-containing protein n=1 Tax=Plasmodium malariae TaxID=5858 RepID=A0A1D3PCI6_PLAMA|nr:conserved Plasmodium protein, unknown function [Plasmodium malariae]SCN12867.1 conserved Plasmodium protein, unknown function [Plasmodium malariae]